MPWTQIDQELDAASDDVRRSAPVRLFCVIAFGLICGGNLGWPIAAVWIPVAFCSMAWGLWAHRARRAQPVSRAFSRINRLAEIVVSSAVWTSVAIVCWRSGDEIMRLIAVSLLSTLLLAAHSYSFKSRSAVLAFGALPGLALVLLPLTLSALPGLKLLSLVFCLALALLYFILDVGQNIGNAKTLRDTQVQLEEQRAAAEAANLAKTAFLAMMSHELRTPMNGVLGMAHALTLTRLDARQARHVDMLVRSGKDLMATLNDILDMSKIEAGKLSLEDIAFDLHDLGRQVRDLFAQSALAKDVRLTCDLEPGAPQWVLGDPTRLRQILTNLVSNALKFTDQGEVRLSIRRAEAGWCDIAVSDTGPGISQDQQARLFQAFAQAEVSTARKFGGTGLGLVICRQLATLMGGRIDLVSDEGAGSTFTVSLPLPEAQAAQAVQEQASPADLTGVRILVADDNLINQAVARAILEAFGAEVIPAGDGGAALDRLKAETFDAVLMDVHMPGMGGIEALSHIRAGSAGSADMPVIALTADALAGVDVRLLAEGFDAVAPKPINPGQLIADIVATIAARTTRRDIDALTGA
jgi:signal transduction histidine kinase/ActR/RegA family two-component response regulator